MKVWKIIRLELLKQRKSFYSTLFVLALGVGVPAVILPLVRPVRTIDSFSGAAAFLIFLLPLAIAFLGASAASALRKTDEKMYEELLPVDPLIRIYGAYIVSFVYNTCISLLVLSQLGVQEVFHLVSIRFGIFQIPIEMLLLYTVSLHCLSFALSYMLNLPVLGAGLALCLSAIDFFFRGVLYLGKHGALMYYFGDRFPEPFYVVFSFPLLLMLLSPAFVARRIERRQPVGFVRILILTICFLVGPVWTFTMALTIANAIDTKMLGSMPFWNSFWDLFAASLP